MSIMHLPEGVIRHWTPARFSSWSWKNSAKGTPRASAILRRVLGRGSRWRFSILERYEPAMPERWLNCRWLTPFWFRICMTRVPMLIDTSHPCFFKADLNINVTKFKRHAKSIDTSVQWAMLEAVHKGKKTEVMLSAYSVPGSCWPWCRLDA